MKKSPINRYEAIGIFGSVAVMALALVLLGSEVDNRLFADSDGTSAAGSVIVAGGKDAESTDTSEQGALAEALTSAATAGGELEKLVVDDVRIGNGAAVQEGDTVVTHYIGSTRDGVQFDSSYARGEPFQFTVGEGKVIEGWEQGVLGMQVGGQRILVIPPDMAYGDRRVGPIAAGSVLVFAVELLEVK